MRKNLYSLTSAEWSAFVTALQAIKSSGVYDAFTRRHQTAMMELTLLPGETGTSRNVAHRGPSFLPWHRRSLRELELELQKVDRAVEIPYWRWESERSTWRSGRIWQMIGGNGSSSQGYRITSGPFANWTSVIWNDVTQSFDSRAGILRRMGSDPLPDVSPASSITAYDVSPWRESSSLTRSFRNRLENYHNTIHVRIGGDMSAGTAPNDPVFWLHHCNIDRLWAEWQRTRGVRNYQPGSGGPSGHNLNDVMRHLVSTSTTPSSVLDWTTLNTYDTLAA